MLANYGAYLVSTGAYEEFVTDTAEPVLVALCTEYSILKFPLCRTPEESIDVNLELCLQAAYSSSNIPVRAEDAERAPPFLDSFGVRALMYAGVVDHSLLSSVQVSDREHSARYKVVMCGGEVAVLTFQLVLQKGVRAAYRSIAAESSWVLQRVHGEWSDLLVRDRMSGVCVGALVCFACGMCAACAGTAPHPPACSVCAQCMQQNRII